MQALLSGIANKNTSLAGGTAGLAIIIGALSTATDLKQQILGCVVGLAVLAMGLFAKDSTTGSQVPPPK